MHPEDFKIRLNKEGNEPKENFGESTLSCFDISLELCGDNLQKLLCEK